MCSAVCLFQANHLLLYSLWKDSSLTPMTPPLKIVSLISRYYTSDYIVSWCWKIFNTCLFPSAAFNKMVSVNGQDFNLQLVDTAGQVRSSSNTGNETNIQTVFFSGLLIIITFHWSTACIWCVCCHTETTWSFLYLTLICLSLCGHIYE